MRKIALIIAVVALGLFTFIPASFAATHSGFGLSQSGGNSEGCAACHVTHAASAAKLLRFGTDQTTFCYACHADDAIGSPYDAKKGRIWNTAYTGNQGVMITWEKEEYLPSHSGGFDKSFDFQTSAQNNGGSIVNDAVYYVANTSTHNVEGITIGPASYTGSNPWNSANALPGANVGFGAGKEVFRCGSCHDPHSADVGNNERLLRKTSVTSVVYNADNVDLTFDANNRVNSYSANMNTWCATCHNLLNAGDNAGHTKQASTNKYMHAMGIVVPNTAGITSNDLGTPLSTDSKLMCLSCHRAHGTAASMTSNLSGWKRTTDPTGSLDATGKGSALLRLDNRDVCYNCHGAAIKNASN